MTFLEKAKDFLTKNPHFFGILFVIFGILGLLASIFDWNLIFGEVSGVTYNLKKVDGWVNFFGRKPARIIFGIGSCMVILAGVTWFLIYAFYYKR
jgi:hypothetical protein